MVDLWKLLIEAQENPLGVPQSIIEEYKRQEANRPSIRMGSRFDAGPPPGDSGGRGPQPHRNDRSDGYGDRGRGGGSVVAGGEEEEVGTEEGRVATVTATVITKYVFPLPLADVLTNHALPQRGPPRCRSPPKYCSQSRSPPRQYRFRSHSPRLRRRSRSNSSRSRSPH